MAVDTLRSKLNKNNTFLPFIIIGLLVITDQTNISVGSIVPYKDIVP